MSVTYHAPISKLTHSDEPEKRKAGLTLATYGMNADANLCAIFGVLVGGIPLEEDVVDLPDLEPRLAELTEKTQQFFAGEGKKVTTFKPPNELSLLLGHSER